MQKFRFPSEIMWMERSSKSTVLPGGEHFQVSYMTMFRSAQ